MCIRDAADQKHGHGFPACRRAVAARSPFILVNSQQPASMPAPKKPMRGGIIDSLASSAPVLPVQNTVTLSRYYRSLDLMLMQISMYRNAQNDEQLYVMLLRYTSMVIETIKQHREFTESAAQYQAAHKRAVAFIEELERLKVLLLAKDISQPQAHTYRRPADARRIEDSATIKDIDWGAAAAPSAATAAGMFGAGVAASAPPLPAGSLDLGADLEWPPRSAAAAGPAAAGAAAGSYAVSTSAPAGAGGSSGGGQPWQEPLSYSSRYRPSDAQLRQKHSLFAPRSGSSGSGSWQQEQQAAASRVRYPSFNASPIDAVWATAPAAAAAASSGGSAPDMGSLSLLEQQQRLLMQPSAGPSLGPQEIEVQNMLPCQGQADGTCAAPPPPPPQQQVVPVSRESTAEAAAAAAAGPKSLSKRVDLRDVHISVALLNDFLHYAASNTRRGVESCGILAGHLSASDSRFTVTTLIVPKQTGTSDTVEMLGEEEVWEVESSRELVPLGWIHTHPTQTCFLSSVDIHTQCGYQTMLEEAVAIVMAPTDSRKKCGIFRLTTPEGLGHVQRCSYRGFHHQCSSVHYELCGHVYMNPNAKHEVIDLRS